MAVDKLVDSTQLNTDLTSVANAIRAKSGGSSQLAFPSGFVSEIGNIPSGGGGTYPWTSSVETVTVGANSITNIEQAKNYFSGYTPYYLIALKTAPDTNNQVVGLFANGERALRYRDGSISTAVVASAYDGKLIEGTQYDVYHF